MPRLLPIIRAFLLSWHAAMVLMGALALFRALGVPGLGLTLLCALLAHGLARWLRGRPLVPGRPVGFIRAAVLQLLLSLSTSGTAQDVAGTFSACLLVLVLLPDPPPGWGRRLRRLIPRVRNPLARPVMGGAA